MPRVTVSSVHMHAALLSDVNKQWLFHGTTYDNADSILRSGFDFRTCRRALYVSRVYFPSESCKACDAMCRLLVRKYPPKICVYENVSKFHWKTLAQILADTCNAWSHGSAGGLRAAK